MPLPIYQVDAFTDRPFAGNPAAVCLLPAEREAAWMQSVAREMNLSETAFLVENGDGFDLRWFTPAVEVDLCGHATLASAHMLWETGRHEETFRFHTRSGLLTATRRGEWIELDFPAQPADPADPPEDLITALGVMPRYVGRNKADYLIELASEQDVLDTQPSFDLLRRVQARGVIVTARATHDVDFISRFFAPAAGVDEDPVTGSAHTCLGPFWAKRLGKNELVGFQASERGGLVKVSVHDDRVTLAGQAVTVLRGELVDG